MNSTHCFCFSSMKHETILYVLSNTLWSTTPSPLFHCHSLQCYIFPSKLKNKINRTIQHCVSFFEKIKFERRTNRSFANSRTWNTITNFRKWRCVVLPCKSVRIDHVPHLCVLQIVDDQFCEISTSYITYFRHLALFVCWFSPRG